MVAPDRLDAWDPLHSPTRSDLYWVTTNIGEALPGVLTPLSWSLWSRVTEGAPRRAGYQLGVLPRSEREVPDDAHRRYTRIFYGRGAMQLKFVTMLGDRMPGTTGEQVALQVLGRVPDGYRFEPTRRRYPIIAWRLPYSFVSVPGRVRSAVERTDAWYRGVIGDVPALDLGQATRFFTEAQARFDAMVELQTLTLFAVVQPLYDALSKLVEATGIGDLASLSGSGGPEMNVVTDIWLASRGELTVEQVLAAHGFHGPLEGELSSHVWREDPSPLRKMIAEYTALDDAADPRRQAAKAEREHADTARAVIAAVPASRRPAVRLLLTLAARRILLRGAVKRAFLQSLDACRAAARRAGEHLAAAERIEQPDDVFYLVVPELSDRSAADLRDLVTRRRERRAEYQALLPLPEMWRGAPPVVSRSSDEEVVESGMVTGIGVSPGQAEGVARVLMTPDFEAVEPGEILVAPTTDPGWSSVMFISCALVVDIGGALSHAAVVAREMGVPCVVNTRDGTRRIRTGDRVRVNGDTGTVEILERAAVQA
jgi:rifampicin phosphotransferase